MEEAAASFPREIIYCRFPILDGSGNPPALLQVAIRTLAVLFKMNVRTLITCSGGMSRSPAIAAAALCLANGGSADDALKQIAVTGPHDVAPSLWIEVRRIAESPF
jgi:protein-tyrosine phosphatase